MTSHESEPDRADPDNEGWKAWERRERYLCGRKGYIAPSTWHSIAISLLVLICYLVFILSNGDDFISCSVCLVCGLMVVVLILKQLMSDQI